VYSAIGAAVAAQHVKDMLDQAAQDHRAAAARRTRRARLAGRPAAAGPARATGRETTTAPC
jgi:hypothetical protein